MGTATQRAKAAAVGAAVDTLVAHFERVGRGEKVDEADLRAFLQAHITVKGNQAALANVATRCLENVQRAYLAQVNAWLESQQQQGKV